jgi:hypothetical protein
MSYADAVAVTPSDTTVLPFTKGLYIGGAGNVNVRMKNGTTILFTALAVGVFHPLEVDKVLATTTTATLIRALY